MWEEHWPCSTYVRPLSIESPSVKTWSSQPPPGFCCMGLFVELRCCDTLSFQKSVFLSFLAAPRKNRRTFKIQAAADLTGCSQIWGNVRTQVFSRVFLANCNCKTQLYHQAGVLALAVLYQHIDKEVWIKIISIWSICTNMRVLIYILESLSLVYNCIGHKSEQKKSCLPRFLSEDATEIIEMWCKKMFTPC